METDPNYVDTTKYLPSLENLESPGFNEKCGCIKWKPLNSKVLTIVLSKKSIIRILPVPSQTATMLG